MIGKKKIPSVGIEKSNVSAFPSLPFILIDDLARSKLQVHVRFFSGLLEFAITHGARADRLAFQAGGRRC